MLTFSDLYHDAVFVIKRQTLLWM